MSNKSNEQHFNIEHVENYSDIFFRDVSLAILSTLQSKVKWKNKFEDNIVDVNVPFYYSLTGDERFLLDLFTDDISSDSRCLELDSLQIPRGHIVWNGFTIKSDEFANPNVWLRTYLGGDKSEIRSVLAKVRALPIVVKYELTIIVDSEIDVYKASQGIMNTLWLYKYTNFEHNFMLIDAIMTVPDDQEIQINREQKMDSDTTIKISVNFEVNTYYPAFNLETGIEPLGMDWVNKIHTIKK